LKTFGKHHLRHAAEKSFSGRGCHSAAAGPNQDVVSLREAQSQKRKATSPMPPEDDLDQEIQKMEMLHQQVQRKKEKMARLADLQKQIDEASEELRHLAQDD
jgi:Tfp pilus assembly protein PilN